MRHWTSPGNFSMSRGNMAMQAAINPRRDMTATGPPPIAAPPVADGPIHYSFNVPFASDLAGPNTEDILHATTDAVLRWTHPEEAPDDVPVHELPVHAMNLAQLRQLCREITANALPIEAHVISATPKIVPGHVTTVCLSGAPELVPQTRETILNHTPLSLVRLFLSSPVTYPCPVTDSPHSVAPLSSSTATWLLTLPRASSRNPSQISSTRPLSSAASTSFCSAPS